MHLTEALSIDYDRTLTLNALKLWNKIHSILVRIHPKVKLKHITTFSESHPCCVEC